MDPLVSVAWLAGQLGVPDLRVLDATWYMPHLQRDPRTEFGQAHVPGAVFFDIDEIADRTSPLPHMLPTPEAFARAVGELGVGDGDRVVVYGGKHLIASARVWWTFRVFGHDRVSVLDGGLAAWRAAGQPLETGVVVRPPRRFVAILRPELVANLGRVRENLESQRAQVLDARSTGRFRGTEPEPRPGLRGGHIPGSVSLPYDRLFREDGGLLPAAGLRAAFEGAGLDLERPVVTTCGSGVSAAVLALGLHCLGRRDASVYDGSWTEWGGQPDTPVAT